MVCRIEGANVTSVEPQALGTRMLSDAYTSWMLTAAAPLMSTWRYAFDRQVEKAWSRVYLCAQRALFFENVELNLLQLM